MGLRVVKIGLQDLAPLLLFSRLRLRAPDELPDDVALTRVKEHGTEAHLTFSSASWPTHTGCCPPEWPCAVVDDGEPVGGT